MRAGCVDEIGECQAEPGGMHSQAEPGNEKKAVFPWFPGSVLSMSHIFLLDTGNMGC